MVFFFLICSFDSTHPSFGSFMVICILFVKRKKLFSKGTNNGSAAEVHGKRVTKGRGKSGGGGEGARLSIKFKEEEILIKGVMLIYIYKVVMHIQEIEVLVNLCSGTFPLVKISLPCHQKPFISLQRNTLHQ